MPQYDSRIGTSTSRTVLTQAEAADYLRVTRRTLYRWRHERRGPRWTYAGRQIRYRRTDLDSYLDARTAEPVADGDQEAR
ncbi:helix-turn-helix domain-containing protein [Arhodomonas aquaeolei]|uniref:helix-turn-helix domain-containing protein n=1 Tax=Arhodomonas aquaeolei TaxID=2369 RepID=UPI00037D82A9|nr:helix-turn-helix domain-containing protein [Arhodomonas aquaeolei]